MAHPIFIEAHRERSRAVVVGCETSHQRGSHCLGGTPIFANWPDVEGFERMVVEALDALPDAMVEGLDNVVFLVEDAPDVTDEVLGIYEGVALTERGEYGYGELPDRIVLYPAPSP